MAQSISLLGAEYSNVPAVELPKTGGGTASFTDVTDTTAAAADVAQGKYFYTAAGVKTEGTSSGGGGSAISVVDTLDEHGGIIRTITAVDLSDTTAVASDVADGKYFYTAAGVKTEGTAVPAVPELQTKSVSITPSETSQSQTVTADSGYDGLDEVDVSVGAISSDYVGTGITRRSSSDLTASGATVTVPAGYYASQVTKAVTVGSASAPSEISGSSATVSVTPSSGTIKMSKTVSVTPVVAAGYISSGTATNSSVILDGHLAMKAAQTYHPSTSDQTIASSYYLTGVQTIKAVTTTNLTASNIKSGVTVQIGDSSDADCVTSVTGTYSGGGSAKNIQVNSGAGSVHTTRYSSTGISITVSKAGTYNVSWMGWRSSSTGTMGTNLYKNGNAGTNQTTWTNTYGQHITLTNQTYAAGDILTLYAVASNTSRYCGAGNLIIEEQ